MTVRVNKPDFDRTKWDWVTTQRGTKTGIKARLDDWSEKRLKIGEYKIIKKLRTAPNRVEYIGVVKKK